MQLDLTGIALIKQRKAERLKAKRKAKTINIIKELLIIALIEGVLLYVMWLYLI